MRIAPIVSAIVSASAAIAVRSKNECTYCRQASAKKDEVWTQFSPHLDQ